ncbi:HAMP domain-containing histidine kinase [Antarcticibacterium flavum]|uniref:histidine kinase n=1 Tax=Antarcticibacterium flavum TaxID=2058175 RepID=A0A5B7X6C8_9FLAO|nr:MULTISPECIES: HAMP domain-containing sensor histidine kinase [Antarcticibacterium]MCM4161478.1 ATP-binding protein [Antarcticibacterium sp. W02-3]QCY71064.1 HAMP domain-containing histidine kinase [Antarcticibacterium flavum]
MIYKNYRRFLLIRLVILFGLLTVLAFSISYSNTYIAAGATILSLYFMYNLYRFTTRRFLEMDDFFESVRYRDFSRWFVEDKGPQDIRKLHVGFNEVNRTIREINSEKDAQYVYLQKILEMVDIGIFAYNINTGRVLWSNESFLRTIDSPSFKNISFVKSRKPLLYNDVFEVNHSGNSSTILDVKSEKLKVLISETTFRVQEDSFRLLVLHNIEETLNQNESEAWKKLLSVMTHEIMNSIAPISSLADTLQTQIKAAANDPETNLLELDDLDAGIASIKKRSEGLMKFAKTYRSLNKVTHLNLEKVKVADLFKNLHNLMQPGLKVKDVHLEFKVENTDLEINIDAYLIEQVLINLLLNAIDAVKNVEQGRIMVSAKQNVNGNAIIRVQDNGKGIPSEIIDSIFIPFFTTKKNGSGIGLSLSKEIMMLHKGKIQVNSEAEKGTIVSLSF